MAADPLRADLRRVLAQSGVYAAAALAQQGVSFLLLPLYTRFVPQAQYGQLELLNAFSSIAFACLLLGLPSAIAKCYHRDCADDLQRRALLPTALLLGAPPLLAGGAVLAAAAGPVAGLLLGSASGAGLVRLMVAGGVLTSFVALVLASLRAEERALAFGVLSLVQFTAAMTANVLLVVRWRLGVAGILWGNLVSYALALALGLWLVRRGRRRPPAAAGEPAAATGGVAHGAAEAAAAAGFALPGSEAAVPAAPVLVRGVPAFDRRLAGPLLRFGGLLIPVLLASWVMDLSDRWVLRLYTGLSDVAVYAVGYKIGMVLQVAVVWPFQLAWPAISFSISRRDGHRETYSRTATLLAAVMAAAIAGLTLLSRVALPALVGNAYRAAYQVVPLVALAYACNGLHYAFSPGVHLAGRTRYFPPLALAAAALNLGLNFLLIPPLGRMGAAWATAIAFAGFALGTAVLGQRFYPVPYEYGKLAKVAAALALVLWLGTRVSPDGTPFAFAWHAVLGLCGVPALLLATGVLRRRRAGPEPDLAPAGGPAG
ncbi:MAG TPA: oligosaccharide flippase family protein [Thermoanaerobaculia bacterium]|nr:oligosaccharide flippase family protein [Thermoanaerobaculia bacterium]